MQRARRQITCVDRYDDAMRLTRMAEYLVTSFRTIELPAAPLRARIAWRGVTAGSRGGITPRR
jgi:hypothetical protein